MENNPKSKAFAKRRGVGAIIGGVILAAILLTTVMLYFVTILNNDQRRASYDIQSAQINADKASEALKVFRDEFLFSNSTGSYINTRMTNDGSLPLIVSYWSLYCLDPGCPSIDPAIAKINVTLNSKESQSRHVGPVTNLMDYRVDFITERGNVVSTDECEVDLSPSPAICVSSTGGGPDFSISASPDVVVLEPDSSASPQIIVTSFNGFEDPVTLTASDPGSGIGSSFSISPVTPPPGSSTSSTLTITTPDSITPGTYNMVVTGTSGGLVHSASVSITVLEDSSGAITEGIIQGTGSLQLDFKAFGALYPQLGTRDGVDQSGWFAKVSSLYSSVRGYPGFQLMTISASTGGGNPVSTTQLAIVESARNLDQSGEDLTLTRFTGINPSLGAIQGSNSQLNYLCHENTAAATVTAGLTAYNENTANKVLQWVDTGAGQTVGWTEMYFCSTGAGTNPNWFTPADLKFANLTPLFLVARGDFADGSPYSQTIPYQAFTIGKGPGTSILNACLLNGDTNTACPSHGTNQGLDPQFRYDADEGAFQSGNTRVWLHLNSGPVFTNGIDVRWLHPDGTYETLLANQATSVINGNRNIEVTLPSSVSCAVPGTDEFHTLVFNDGRDGNGDRYIYYMTFKVDC